MNSQTDSHHELTRLVVIKISRTHRLLSSSYHELQTDGHLRITNSWIDGHLPITNSQGIDGDGCRVVKIHRMPYLVHHFLKLAPNHRALLREMTYKDKASYVATL